MGKRILAFATQGAGGHDEARLRVLLRNFDVDYFPFNYSDKRASFQALRQRIPAYDLSVMEGTGISGGLALLLSGRPYVVSSGDAIAPFIAAKWPAISPLFGLYERELCRRCSGFIGWTPYLAGRALTYGAPRAMTAAGWAPEATVTGMRVREQLGIPAGALVIGIVGWLDWHARLNYCYGMELVRALRIVKRPDVVALIVGDGTGLAQLNGDRVILPGRVPREEVPDYLAAMDIASLPQSRDRLGSFRYSTKLPEYIAARLPVVTGQLPLAYDLDSGWMWRLPGAAPWTPEYIQALADLLENMTSAEVAAKREAVPARCPIFDRESQVERVTRMIHDIL